MKKSVFFFCIALYGTVFLLAFRRKDTKLRAAGGHALFIANCSPCHGTNKAIVGPPFQGIRQDYPLAWIDAMVQNHDSFCNSADIRAQYIHKVWQSGGMSVAYHLTDAEIISVLDYVDSMPRASNYYAHRKMSEKELNAQLEYIDTYPGGNFGQNERILDSLQKL